MSAEKFTSPLMILENVDLAAIEAAALKHLGEWYPRGLRGTDAPSGICCSILETAGAIDRAEAAVLEKFGEEIKPEDYPEAVRLALAYFRGL
ncbi:hypothetical protein FTO70_14370 [Methanosarcina sp. KYL-1]|uniref:hypothetical protein n=1 Tax=Methanosarcina sp. KYL-1 TaxID=2602068 RepID=UPI0021017C79|nr:hypothetical protein [Methanosarcina sp. KYL-1]MCQ1536835.1 hypothetical protein [Methanosarcina sp. KYL-1]